MDPKYATFCQVDIRILVILGGPKSRFLDFFDVVLELFKKCLGIVFDLKGLLLGVFLALKVDKWPEKLNFRSKFGGGFEESYFTIFKVERRQI